MNKQTLCYEIWGYNESIYITPCSLVENNILKQCFGTIFHLQGRMVGHSSFLQNAGNPALDNVTSHQPDSEFWIHGIGNK